jgi:hypothetical protein
MSQQKYFIMVRPTWTTLEFGVSLSFTGNGPWVGTINEKSPAESQLCKNGARRSRVL